ncbi:MAG: DUF615 domain-containing protein [Mailhella sp.]|nr:DUF615 domain-containing protein [Mailhella sp.]
MSRKQRFQISGGEETDAGRQVSKSQKKRDSAALQKLGEDIAALPKSALGRLPLGDDLREAILGLSGISAYGARRRQMQYIGRLMREAGDDAKAIAEAYEDIRRDYAAQ